MEMMQFINRTAFPAPLMRIAKDQIDIKSKVGSIVITPTSCDDMYVLSSIILPGSVVEATTTRKLSMDGGRTQQKIVTRLAIKTETANFDLEDGIIYLKGRVCRENEHVQLGSYHTLNIQLNDSFYLYKETWTREDRAAIKEAAKESPSMCFAIFYDRECVVSLVSANSIQNVYKGEVKNKNFKLVNSAIVGVKDRVKTIIIASCTSAAEEFYKVFVKENKAVEKSTGVVKLGAKYKGIPNSRVIENMLVDESFLKYFAGIEYVDSLRAMEHFAEGMYNSNQKARLGLNEVLEAIDYGAIDMLFITSSLYRPKTVEERRNIEKLIASVKELRVPIHIIPTSHELGEKLKAVGGIAAHLKFIYF